MKKAMVAILAASMLTVSALGLAACQKVQKDTTPDTPPDDATTTSHTVTFNVNGGAWSTTATDNADKTVAVGTDGKVAFPTNPLREDYSFAGWYTQASGGDKRDSTYIFASDATLYAHWNEIPAGGYTITLDANGGVLNSDSTLKTNDYGKLEALPAAPTPNNVEYEFKGWYDNYEGGTKITPDTVFGGDTTIYAQYQAPVVDTGNGVYVGGELVAVLEDNTLNIVPPEVATREYFIKNLTLSAGDVVTFQIDGVTLTHTANDLELWTSNCHGVAFSQSAGTFTVKTGEAPFDIYIRFYPEYIRQESNPGDNGDCWTIEMTDGLTDSEDTRVACVIDTERVYLVGQMFGDTGFEWNKGFEMTKSGSSYSITVDLEAGNVIKVREHVNYATGNGLGYNDLIGGSDIYFNDVGGDDHNMEVIESGNYTITMDSSYKLTVVKN